MPNLSPADLAGQRRRRDYDLPRRDAVVCLASRRGAATDGPGAAERADQLAQAEALRSIDWGTDDPRETEADRAAAEEVELLQLRLADFDRAMQDDDREILGLPTTDYGTLPGPAEGHALPRRALRPLALVLIGIAIGGCVLALLWPWLAPLVHGWLSPDVVTVAGRVLT